MIHYTYGDILVGDEMQNLARPVKAKFLPLGKVKLLIEL